MADDRLRFILEGRDDLSRALTSAGESARRMHTRVTAAAAGSRRSLARFSRDARGQMRDASGRITSASRVISRALTRTGEDADDAARQIRTSTTSMRRSLDDTADDAEDAARRIGGAADDASTRVRRMARDSRGRFVRVGDDADEGESGLRRFLGTLRSVASTAAQSTASLGQRGISGVLAGIGPAAAVSTLPALGALVPMLVGAATAGITAKLAFKGVGEAVALAGEDQEAYAEALKEMSPAQRAFTKQVVEAKKEFSGLSEEVQEIVLPEFTKALKNAKPAIGVFKGGIRDMAGVLAGFGSEFGKLFASDRFSSALERNLKLGSGFLGSLAKPLTTVTQSILDFGAASKPTLDSFGRGISGLLSQGLPGFFQGLQGGIKGSAAMFDGLFAALNKVLPALGELAGSIANAVGPALGELFASQGDIAAGAMRGLAGAMRFLKPIFGEVGAFARVMSTVLVTMGGAAKDAAMVIVGSLWPSFREAEDAVGPIQRLARYLEENKHQLRELSRIAANFIIEFASQAITHLPNVIMMFRLMATGILTALDGIVSGAATAFGWIPGIGEKLQSANTEFDTFKNKFIAGLHTAEGETRAFSQRVVPRLERNRLKMNIDNWRSQIAIAKQKLSDKNLPPEKRARLLANIRDLQNKVARAKRELNSLPPSRTITVTTHYRTTGQARTPRGQGAQLMYAQGGPVGYPTGGQVRGPGTSTSDSILARLSDGEFVVRAAAVKKYGTAFLEEINAMRAPRFAAGGALGTHPAAGGMIDQLMRAIVTALQEGLRRALGGGSLTDVLRHVSSTVTPKAVAAAVRQTSAPQRTAPKTGMDAAVRELTGLVQSGRWRRRSSWLFEDLSYRGMSSNYRRYHHRVADDFWAAVREVQGAVINREHVAADSSYPAMSPLVRKYHKLIDTFWSNPKGRHYGDWGRFYRNGGMVHGPGTGTSDSVPARLSTGEFVVRSAAVRAYGRATLERLNAGQLPVRAAGAGTAARGGVTVVNQVTVNGAVDPIGTARTVRKMLVELKRTSGRNYDLGIA